MKDKFEYELSRKIRDFPDYRPDGKLWENISDELDFDVKVQTIAKELSQVSHRDDLWNNIEKQIVPHIRLEPKNIFLSITSLSAAVALIVIITFYFYKEWKRTTTVYSEEYILTEPAGSIQEGGDPAEFLQKWCSRSADICNEPAISDKMQKINELNSEIKHINEIIETYGESPSLIKVLIKMENQRAGLIKDLFKTLRT